MDNNMIAGDAPATSIPAPKPDLSLMLPALASIGAGVLHATAVGVHGGHASTVSVFVAMTMLQVGWGIFALKSPSRALAGAGVVLGGAATVGWFWSTTQGISFLDGLEESHGFEWAPATAAGLAVVAGLGALLVAVLGRLNLGTAKDVRPIGAAVGATLLTVVAAAGLVSAGNHSEGGHDHTAAAVPPVAFNPPEATNSSPGDSLKPGQYDVDLSGVDGVSPKQQAKAEKLVETTLTELPQFADASKIEELGFSSIGDGFLGHEHFINWNYINDDKVLDPNYPESLVYRTSEGGQKLVSAMFMLKPGSDLNTVPDVGGKLTQWHVHDNLCFTESTPPRVAGITQNGSCSPGTQHFPPVPMIHVWIVPNKCGPFAALEGVAGGQVKPGEAINCDAAHADGGL